MKALTWHLRSVPVAALLTLGVTGAAAPRAVWDERAPQPATTASSPAYCSVVHDVGRLYLPVTNSGMFGRPHTWGARDCFTGETVNGCEFPKGSWSAYLADGGLWVGAIVGRDTLVSASTGVYWAGGEFNPDSSPMGDITYRSNVDPTSPYYAGAVSEQDYTAIYYDTCRRCSGVRPDILDGRPHRPLYLEVTQKSYAWSYSYARDLVLIDYRIRNIGDDRLTDMYIGIYADGDVYSTVPSSHPVGPTDDFCGFIEYQPAHYLHDGCPVDSDLVNLAWSTDNDGDLSYPQEYMWVPHVTGTKIVRTPRDSLRVSFNWWSPSRYDTQFDFGPQGRASYRDLGFGNLGTPYGDRNMYYFLRNGEHDYDQLMLSRHGYFDPVWMPPPIGWVDTTLNALDSRYLLSFGPFGLDPGQSLPVTIAYVAGARLHRQAGNARFIPEFPEQWYENVFFDSLMINATWADWIYDNPGVDTDSDGYAGEFTLCDASTDSTLVCDTFIDTTPSPDTLAIECHWERYTGDTVWRKGDGVPDFRGATPPINPSTYHFINPQGDTIRGLRVEPSVGQIRLIWNGAESENTPDPFSREYDFEGYSVWIARDNRLESFSVAQSYDRENYNRWDWNEATDQFVLRVRPLTLAELRCMYGDSCGDTTWLPEQYPRNHPLVIPGGSKNPPRIHYFEPMGYNRFVFGNDQAGGNTTIRKVYPDAPKPPVVDPDSIAYYFPGRDDTLYFTPDGFLKYYEYEYTFEDLLPTVSYWVNVTAFDYGFRQIGLAGLETSPALMPVGAFALPSTALIEEQNLDVFVYPNPYRKDGNYRRYGFEGRGEEGLPDDYVRLIHFANLPPKCTIRIFSLDGDLIREIEHDVDPIDHLANHDTWDLINRNHQLVVTGLYYWTVEDDRGNTQIGKLVIIM